MTKLAIRPRYLATWMCMHVRFCKTGAHAGRSIYVNLHAEAGRPVITQCCQPATRSACRSACERPPRPLMFTPTSGASTTSCKEGPLETTSGKGERCDSRSAGGERSRSQRVNAHHVQPPRPVRISSLHLFSPSTSKSTSLLTQSQSRSRKEAYSDTSMIRIRGSLRRPPSSSCASGHLSPSVWGK
jgi:hypothetical protein